jgi:uncharacterized protein DUF4136
MKRLWVLPLLMAMACSTTPPEFAWDKAASFANLKTFAWFDGEGFQYPRGGSIVDGRFVDENVRRDVEQELARKGYRKDDGSPDFFVTYHTNSAGVSDRDVYGSYSWWSPVIYVGSAYERNGTLVLDIRDRGHKLVWRGAITRPSGQNPKEVGEAIQEAVTVLLQKFPPST